MWVSIGSPVIKILLSFLLFVSLFGVFTPPTPVFASTLSISSKTPDTNALDIVKTSDIVVHSKSISTRVNRQERMTSINALNLKTQ